MTHCDNHCLTSPVNVCKRQRRESNRKLVKYITDVLEKGARRRQAEETVNVHISQEIDPSTVSRPATHMRLFL
jgi:hypothetical protein